MPRATPRPEPEWTDKQLEDRYYKDLKRLFPDEDGRRWRGLARRMSVTRDLWERELILSEELEIEPRNEYRPRPEAGRSDGDVETPRSRRRKELERNSVPAQRANQRGGR